MTAPATIRTQLLGGDSPRDLLAIVGMFALYALLDNATRVLSDMNVASLDDPFLLTGAIRSSLIPFLAALVGLASVTWRWPGRIWARWTALDRGPVLRALAAAFLVVLTWQGSLYEYNYLLDQAHLLDRLVLVVLAVASFYRPVFLSFFALQSRVIAGQFEYPFGTTAAQNIDELLVIALLAIAAAHLLYVFTGSIDTSPVLLILSAAIATHFFIPGRSKLAIDWLSTNDISNLPLSGYTAGWLGQGDGSFSRQMSNFASNFNSPLLVGTLAIELGSVLAAMHYKLMRWWLPIASLFHLVTFLYTGFWFLTWLTFEIGLLIIFTRRSLRDWLDENSTPLRAAITAAAVLFAGSLLFHPPKLAWLDAPVSYGYRIEATGESGMRYQVPISTFSPVVQELSFFNLRLDTTEPASGGYGAVGSPQRIHQLSEVTTFAQLKEMEEPSDPGVLLLSRKFMMIFMDRANGVGGTLWSSFAPPDHFWTGNSPPSYSFDESLARLDVFVLRAIHDGGNPRFERELVLTLTLDEDGHSQVAFPET